MQTPAGMIEPTWSQALEQAFQSQGGEEAIENALDQRSRCQSALLDAGHNLELARRRKDLRAVKHESEDVVFWGNEEKGWEGFIDSLYSRRVAYFSFEAAHGFTEPEILRRLQPGNWLEAEEKLDALTGRNVWCPSRVEMSKVKRDSVHGGWPRCCLKSMSLGRGCSRPHVKRFTLPATPTPDSSPKLAHVLPHPSAQPRQLEYRPLSPPPTPERSCSRPYSSPRSSAYGPPGQYYQRPPELLPRVIEIPSSRPGNQLAQYPKKAEQMSPPEIDRHFGTHPSPQDASFFSPQQRTSRLHKGWYNDDLGNITPEGSERRASVVSKMLSWRGWRGPGSKV